MKYRIAIWASAGFLVAAFWALLLVATFPSMSAQMGGIRVLINLTCPIAIVHRQVSVYESLVANAFTYALVGLVVETLRRQLHHAK